MALIVWRAMLAAMPGSMPDQGIARGARRCFLAGNAMDAAAAPVEHVPDIDENGARGVADGREIALDDIGRRQGRRSAPASPAGRRLPCRAEPRCW